MYVLGCLFFFKVYSTGSPLLFKSVHLEQEAGFLCALYFASFPTPAH